MDELTRRALIDRVASVIADYDARELSDTDIDGLNGEELDCIMECLQFGQVKERISKASEAIAKRYCEMIDGKRNQSIAEYNEFVLQQFNNILR